jgi:hypothetical protein
MNYKRCISCGKKNLQPLINLKKYPVTGIFCKEITYSKKNLRLLYCNYCTHIFHTSKISKNIYNPKIYYNKPSKNFLAKQAITFFKKFVLKNLKKKSNIFLEIGAGDLTLCNSMKQNSDFYYIIDPAMKNYHSTREKIKVYQKSLEDFNLKKITNKTNVDAILLSHVLEHAQNPSSFLKNIVDNIEKNTSIFIEVPCSELMIKNLRFDQIFFNHKSYFTLKSIKALFKNLGLRIINSTINLDHWGGTMLFALIRNKEKQIYNFHNNKNFYKTFLRNFQIFKKKIEIVKIKISKEKEIIGYGAGQNTPTICYFLNTNLNFLKYIVDDDSRKHAKYCINTATQIKKFDPIDLNSNSYLLTALDNSENIFQKLIKMKIKSRKIINIKKYLSRRNYL